MALGLNAFAIRVPAEFRRSAGHADELAGREGSDGGAAESDLLGPAGALLALPDHWAVLSFGLRPLGQPSARTCAGFFS